MAKKARTSAGSENFRVSLDMTIHYMEEGKTNSKMQIIGEVANT